MKPRLIAPLLAGLMMTFGSSAADAPKPATFRVMTYNIHHGEGLDGKVDLPRIADLIKQEGADIVALQEVDKGTQRTAKRDLGAELAKLTGLSCVFSNNYDFQGGEYGNAVLTRFPVRQATNTHYVKVNETEQRGLLQLSLDVRGREVVIMATHIDHRRDDAARWSNVGEIEALAKRYTGKPIILCGDFNDGPTSRVCRRLNETFDDTWARVGQGDGFTIPAEKPSQRIDYLWISKDGDLVPRKAWVPFSEASDHRSVVAELALNPPRILPGD
jgi:endonuclease/exonuclease/phosphatase family metal-dependent hydrolase